MSERYTRLFSLPENLGQEGAPVVISAGALLRDNNTGKVIVQLKLRNISEQTIKSVKVKVNAFDTAGDELKGAESFSYMDLAVERNGVFASQTPILLQDKTTRSFSVEILSVVFSNGTVYQPNEGKVAAPVTGETLKTVQKLDEERTLAAKRKKTRIIFFLPLIMDVLAIVFYVLFNSVNPLNGVGVKHLVEVVIWYGGYWSAWLVSFVVPGVCILVHYKCEGKPKWIKAALAFSLTVLLLQILAAFWWKYLWTDYFTISRSEPELFRLIVRVVNGRDILTSESLYRVLQELHLAIKYGYDILVQHAIWHGIYRLIPLLFVGKNLCACIVLFLQVRRKKLRIKKI